MRNEIESYIHEIWNIHRDLGIPDDWRSGRLGPMFRENLNSVQTGVDKYGRDLYLAQACSHEWLRMQAAAEGDGVRLLAVSGFRSVRRQQEIIKKKLEAGLALGDILKVNAAPGFSQHHTGFALDLADDSSDEPLTDKFEVVPAFLWLSKYALRFGFSLQYPRDNIYGFVYEPWHWAMDKVRDFEVSVTSFE
jgi:zinc D-Ala-D-Ala carboxypeptidase